MPTNYKSSLSPKKQTTGVVVCAAVISRKTKWHFNCHVVKTQQMR